MIIKRNGIEGKKCSTCHKWKPLTEFPNDRTHSIEYQGGKHCRCKSCHREKRKNKI